MVTKTSDIPTYIRPAKERLHTQIGWLDSWHTFSFGRHYDPAHMGFGVLRVLNDDWVEPARGFGKHPHSDMEILTIVLEGRLAHEDSLGTIRELVPGDVQVMSAGTGIQHSEFNPSSTDRAHFLQIWIEPKITGGKPGYADRKLDPSALSADWVLLASPDGAEGSFEILQDARVWATHVEAGGSRVQAFGAGRKTYLHVAEGRVMVGGQEMSEGDGAGWESLGQLEVVAADPSKLVLFDLP